MSIFPDPIRSLPLADIPIEGLTAHLSQGDGHQLLFMEFEKNVELPEHSHEAQWGVILRGRIDLTIAGEKHTFRQGDSYFIASGVPHSARIYAGYADVTFFAAPDRYSTRISK